MKNTQRRFIHAEVEEARSMQEVLEQSHLFEIAVQKALHEGVTVNEPHEWTCLVADYSHDLGIREENTKLFVTRRLRCGNSELCIMNCALAVANTYATRKGTFGACRTMSKTQRTQFLVNDFLNRNYRLRFNVMTRQTEYADLGKLQASYQPLDSRTIYNIKERAAMAGISLTDNEMSNRLTSKSIRDFYPMADFLGRLPKWDGRPRIKKLAETIPTDDTEWPSRFYTWFLSMVSHWHMTDTRFANQLIPVLVGPQGCGKSQWVRALLPEELQNYYHDGFDLRRRAEAEAMMSRYGLINIDEFDSITPGMQPILKHLVQLAEVKTNGQPERRFCSFIATCNHADVQADISGSRRYIFVNVKGQIKLSHRLSLLQAYAEAMAALENNERTYLDRQQEQEMQQVNEEFRQQDISEQLFLHHFTPLPTRQEESDSQWLTAVEILSHIEKHSKKDLGIRRATTFGRILLKHCGKMGSKFCDGIRRYHVRQK